MEGYLIRVPVEACFPDSRPVPVWRQRSDHNTPVHSRLLYYVVEEGFMRGYESPDTLDEPVETFQLTSHRIEVNAMYSLNIFELKARTVNMPPSRQFVEDTSSSSSDSSDDENEQAVRHTPPSIFSSSPLVPPMSGSYHVVFFAADKELVKKWSVKLLNWNRYVFSSGNHLDEAGHKMAKVEIIESLRIVNSADRFLRPVHLRTMDKVPTTSDEESNTRPSLEQVNILAAPVDLANMMTLNISSTLPTETAKTISPIDPVVMKPSDSTTQQTNLWWIAPFGRSRRISSYSLR